MLLLPKAVFYWRGIESQVKTQTDYFKDNLSKYLGRSGLYTQAKYQLFHDDGTFPRGFILILDGLDSLRMGVGDSELGTAYIARFTRLLICLSNGPNDNTKRNTWVPSRQLVVLARGRYLTTSDAFRSHISTLWKR